MIKNIVTAVIFTFACTVVACQDTSIDSVKIAMSKETRDTAFVDKLQEIAEYYRNVNKDSAIAYMQQALTLSNEIGYLNGKMQTLESIGLMTRGGGDIPTALDYFFQGLQVAEDNHKPDMAELFLIDIGHVYRDLGDYDNAMDYYKRANKIVEAKHDERESAFLLWNIGNIHNKLNHPDSSLFYKRKAREKFKLLELQSGYEYMMAGDIEFELGNHALAFDYLHKSIEVSRKLDIRIHEIFGYIKLAEFFRDLNQSDSCIYYAKKVLALAMKSTAQIKVLEASRILSEQYESRDVKEELYYRKIADSVNENLFGSKKVVGLQKIVTREQERRRKIEEENIAYQNKLKQYALMAGLLIAFFIAFLLYRNNKNKQKANKLMAATLSHLKATQSQLIQSEKMASLGELTAGIAHEIQNPLNFVNNFSEVSRELIDELKNQPGKLKEAEQDEILNNIDANLEKINHHGQRAADIVKGMLQHTQKGTGQKEPRDINKLADEYLRLSYQGFRAKNKSFSATMKTDFDETIGNINIIPQDIGRALLNLYNNAFYAAPLPPGGGFTETHIKHEPTVWVSTKKIGDKVLISVRDNGPGIPKDIIDKIFQPFFTTKPTGQGTGLGLSLAYDIIKAHGGEIRVETKDGFTEFITQLPIV